MIGRSIPGSGWEFHSSPPSPGRIWSPPSLLCNGYQRFFPYKVKRPGREADHSPPSSAEVKNAWYYTSIPPYALMAWCSVKIYEQLYLYLYYNIKLQDPLIVVIILLSHYFIRLKTGMVNSPETSYLLLFLRRHATT
jgi:hypothetical protein